MWRIGAVVLMLFGLIGIAAPRSHPCPAGSQTHGRLAKSATGIRQKSRGSENTVRPRLPLIPSPCRLFTDSTVAAVICESEGAVIAVALTKGSWKVIFGPIPPPSEKALEKLRQNWDANRTEAEGGHSLGSG